MFKEQKEQKINHSPTTALAVGSSRETLNTSLSITAAVRTSVCNTKPYTYFFVIQNDRRNVVQEFIEKYERFCLSQSVFRGSSERRCVEEIC